MKRRTAGRLNSRLHQAPTLRPSGQAKSHPNISYPLTGAETFAAAISRLHVRRDQNSSDRHDLEFDGFILELLCTVMQPVADMAQPTRLDAQNCVMGYRMKNIELVTDTLRAAPLDLPPSLREVVEYRKSGLSLNHVVGCPLDCGYCVRHLFDNYDMKRPHLVMDDATAVQTLMGHWAFRRHTTPIQIFNRATDPMLPRVKEHLHRTLELLDGYGLTNPVLVITRWRVDREDVERFERLSNLKLTVLVTWSGIADKRIEPVDSTIAETSLATLASGAHRTKRILYWRPVVAGLNDDDHLISRARELAQLADATVFTGLFHREEIRAYLRSVGVPDLYNTAPRRKIMPRSIEKSILAKFTDMPIFRKTSCAVAFAHGIADYNGHLGIEHICDICPPDQVRICTDAYVRPSQERIDALAAEAGLRSDMVEIRPGRILVSDSTEQQRYFIQHATGFQVHDRAHPHLPGRHGRAEEGWE